MLQAPFDAWHTAACARTVGRLQLRDVVETLLVQAWLVVTGPWPPPARWP